MQAIAIACGVLFVVADYAKSQGLDDGSSSLYTKRYERLDIDTILASPRLVTNYVECLLNKKPCAPEGKALKRILPEALRTKCSRCHPSQKEVALKVITALYFDYPQYYKALKEKWDPTGEYNRRFEEYLRDQKFNSIGGESDQGEQAQGSSVSINITQRPTRQGQGTDSKPAAPSSTSDPSSTAAPSGDLPEISNRFGSDDDSGYDYASPKSTVLPSTTKATAAPQTPQKPPTAQQPQKPQTVQQPQKPQQPAQSPAPRPSNNGGKPSGSGGASKPSSGSASHSASVPSQIWSQSNHHTPSFSTSTTYYLPSQNPVLNIINRITMKFANTAEFFAAMLRGVVPLTQATPPPIYKDDLLRKLCDRFRKTILSHTNNENKKNHHRYY